MFFTKGLPTYSVGIYDLRTNIEGIIKGNPLQKSLFEDFEIQYAQNSRKETERFTKFSTNDIKERNYNLDIFWLRHETSRHPTDLPDPVSLVDEASMHLDAALSLIKELQIKLDGKDKIENG